MKTDILNDYTRYIKKYISLLDNDNIANVADIIKVALEQGKVIYVCGNGGSMATAKHMSEDLMLNNDIRSKVVCLDNLSSITAIGNDTSYDEIFSIQLHNLMDRGDILICISCSGNSPNVVNAIRYANKIGTTISITGFDGGTIKKESTHNVHVPSEKGEYELTEDIHLIICHMIATWVKNDISI